LSKRDYYEILGLSKNATDEEIKRAYRTLAVNYHPDKHQGDRNIEERFKEISEAYEALSDPNKRAAYDQFGHEGLKGAFGAGGFQWQNFTHFSDFSDIFSGLEDFFESFGIGSDIFGFGRRGHAGPRRGANLQYEVEIDLKEAAFGTEKAITVPRAEACGLCEGKGTKKGTKESVCRACGGRGQINTISGFFSISRTCGECSGQGKIIKNPCPECSGTGTMKINRKIKVNIPRGVDDRIRLRINGEGEAGERGGPRGDLYVTIYVKEHEVFERHEDDIYCELQIPFAAVVFGGEVEAPTLEESVKIKIPAGTQSGKIFCLKNKGIYHLSSQGRGDHLCKVVVKVPTDLTDEQKKKLKEFAEACGESPQLGAKSFVKKVKDMLR